MSGRTGGDALAEQLLTLDTGIVFGVPGAQLDHAVDALARRSDSIRFLHARHEQGAGHMADGHARTSGRPSVMMVVPGPGVLNAASAMATAWACSSPVVAIVATIPTWASDQRAGVLHEIADQTSVLRGITERVRTISSADEIPDAVAEAFTEASSGRPRPAVVQIPADLFAQPASAPTVPPEPVRRPAPDPIAVASAASVLRNASSPLIIAGQGVTAADAGTDLVRLAERLGAPLVLTTNGKGATDHDHPLVLPMPVGRELLPAADAVLGVGTRLVNAIGRPMPVPESAALVLLNVDETDLGGWRSPTVTVHADARLGVRALLDALDVGGAPNDPMPAIIAARQANAIRLDRCRPLSDHVDAVRRGLPRDAIVVADLTQVGYLANAVFPVHAPRSYLTSGWQGTLGYAWPTALGAKVANPDRAVVALVGDGGFGFTLGELATAARHGIAAIAVCFVDGAYGNVRRTQADLFDGRFIGTDLANPDFVAVATAHGIHGERAHDPDQLCEALHRAVSADRPAVIEVPVGDMPSPWPLFEDRPAPID